MAGGALTANVTSLNNIEGTGKQYVEDSGTAHSYWCHHESGHDSTGHSSTSYAPPTATDISVKASAYENNTTPIGSGVVAGSNSYSSLFMNAPDPTAKYFVETDPAYTNKKNFLSSDYFFEQMNYDANRVAKRLGDGYYEQKLVADQIMNLTGKRFVENAQSNEEQYKLFLDYAAKFAKDSDLTIGVALTSEEQGKLKEEIVWMVEESVLLPNGKIVKALVPKVYVPTSNMGYGTRTAAIISASDIDVKAVNDILNQGIIVSGNTTKISAENINNNYGKIQGSNVILEAQNDDNNVGGTLIAEKSMDISAERDVNIETTTSTATNDNGSRTSLNQVAGVYVTGEEGKLKMSSGREVNLTSADISLTGEKSNASIIAGRDINLNTTETSSANNLKWDKKSYRNDSSTKFMDFESRKRICF